MQAEAGAHVMGAKDMTPFQALSGWGSPGETVTLLQAHQEQEPGSCWAMGLRYLAGQYPGVAQVVEGVICLKL